MGQVLHGSAKTTRAIRAELQRSEAPVAQLAKRFGPYQTAKRRYYRWIEQGVIARIFEAVSDDPDIEWLAIDATVIRAQAQAAGARIKRMARPVGKWFEIDALISLRNVSGLWA